jgi:succinate-semialdehyde dehydrogenase/glutarate-semialdehyde dehydrogenase
MEAKFRNAGQACIAANRIFVHAGVHDAFLKKLQEQVANLRVGNGFDETTDIGPLVNKAGFDKVDRLVSSAIAQNAKVLIGGKRSQHSVLNGYFYGPTILDGVKQSMDVYNEEIFGPVVSTITFKTEEQVIQMANELPVGLAAYVMTSNRACADRMVSQLQTGMVGINQGIFTTEFNCRNDFKCKRPIWWN